MIKFMISVMVIIVLLIIMAMSFIGFQPFDYLYVEASAGSTSTTIVLSDTGTQVIYGGTVKAYVDYCLFADTIGGGNFYTGWDYDLRGIYKCTIPSSGMFSFDISSIPADAEILNAQIIIIPTAKVDTCTHYNDFYWSLYKTNPGTDYTLTVDDADNWKIMKQQGYGRQTAPQHYTSLTVDAEYEVEILMLDESFERYGTSDKIWFQCLTENHGMLYDPGYYTDGTGIRFAQQMGGGYPKLVVEYVSEPAARTSIVRTPGAVNPTPLGTEVADNITLDTLRCMYTDEKLSFVINGEWGANITLELLTPSGSVIESHSDSVRKEAGTGDLVYPWNLQLPSDYNGFVRVHETNFDLWSSYVCVQPSPSSTQATNKVYSEYTIYPQYTKLFSGYVVDDGDLMYIHWKTNIDGADLADITLELYSNGNSGNPVYSENMTDMAVEYFDGTEANQEALCHWRYAVFTPTLISGQNDYGGLVNNLNFNGASLRRGFIQPVIIYNDDGSEYASTHSAYWYLTAADKGLVITMPDKNVSTEQTPVINISVGNECKVESNLDVGVIEAIGFSHDYFKPALGNNRIVMQMLSHIGAHTARVTLTKPENHTYQYIYDIPFTVTETGEGTGTGTDESSPVGIWQKFLAFLGAHGGDSDVGHWIVLIIVMVGSFILLRQSSILRVAIPLMVLGAAIVAGWVDKWLIVLLALGAGLSLWSIFRKKTSGGTSEGEG